MGRTKRFINNSITMAFYQLILMISGFITVKIIIENYGSEINGLIASINQFIVYFKLVEAGLSTAATYALYKPLAEKDIKGINGIVVASKNFYNQAGYIFVILTIGLALVYPFFVSVDTLSMISVGIIVLILGVNGALEFFTLAKYRVLLTADQKTYVISLASVVYTIINTTIIVVFAILNVNIVIVLLLSLSSVFARTLILLLYVKFNYKFINYREKPNNKALNKRWDALYLQILGVVQTGAPILILTVVTRDLALVSIYSVYNLVVQGLNGILGIFKSGLFASFGDVIARGEIKTLQKAYSEFEFSFYSIVTTVYSIAFVMIIPFVKIYTNGATDVNYELPLIGFLMVLNGIVYNIKVPQGMLVNSAGLFKETRTQATIQALILIVFGFIFTAFMGIAGVLIASILSNIYRDIDLLFYIPRKVTKLPVKNTVIRIFRVFITSSIICLPTLFIDINVTGYLSWLITALLVGIYAVIVVFIMGLLFEKSNIIGIKKRITSLIK